MASPIRREAPACLLYRRSRIALWITSSATDSTLAGFAQHSMHELNQTFSISSQISRMY